MTDKVYRALIVSPTPTWPLDYGNRKRIYSVCKGLQSRGFEIHFVHYASEGDWRNNMPIATRKEMEKQWDFVDHVYPTVELHPWPRDGEDHVIDEWWDSALENHLKHIFNARSYDLLVVNYTWLSKALEVAPKSTFKVLDTHDKFSGRRSILEKNGISKEFFHTTVMEESKGLSRADLVWAIKEEEQFEFESMGVDAKVETLLHIDEQREPSQPRLKNGYVTFGFIGARNNINKVNLRRFIDVALPIFEKHLPPLELLVAGSICKELDSVENPFLKKLGYVDTVDSFYDAIDVALVPMEFSTGLKIKAGEALAQSKALLAHAHAMEGYPSTHEMHACKSFEEIALAMCELAYEPARIAEIETASVSSYRICSDHIEKVLNRLRDYVSENYNLVFVLPESFGDEKSPVHWLCQAHMDWLSWRLKPLYLSLYPSRFDFNDSRVRYVDESRFKALLETNPECKIYCLDDGSLSTLEPYTDRVVDFFNINEKNQLSFVPIKGKVAAPGIGHKKIPAYLDLLYPERLGVVAIRDATVRPVIDQLLSCFKIEEREEIISPFISTFKELDVFVRNYINRFEALPRIIVLAKKREELNYAEQFLIDILNSSGIQVVQLNGFVDSFKFKLSNNQDTPDAIRSRYDSLFYESWKKAEAFIAKDITNT